MKSQAWAAERDPPDVDEQKKRAFLPTSYTLQKRYPVRSKKRGSGGMLAKSGCFLGKGKYLGAKRKTFLTNLHRARWRIGSRVAQSTEL